MTVQKLFEETDETDGANELAGTVESVETLVESGGVKVEKIVSRGAVSPKGFWYDQETDEWVMVARGGAVLEFEEGGLVAMEAGDHVMIPRRKRHRVLLTSRDAVWVAVHLQGTGNVRVGDAGVSEEDLTTEDTEVRRGGMTRAIATLGEKNSVLEKTH